ncbi:kinase-like domain-containing protein, partial [Suillus clintonianus]|uniref:kinase-like domain-containing protein n=1 Tax=Suillus clintonianus TaxID=1904413 RepID=UPI001B873E73
MELKMSFQTKDHICFVMDLMAGDLHHLLTHGRKYCRKNTSRWSAQMALGINALHEMGIIHRDIKAENILVDIRENVKIADFGLSYISEVPLDPKGEYISDVQGTIYCMVPEMLCNLDVNSMKYGPPVDWWSFGCVLYELMSKDNMARSSFASFFAAISLIPSCQPLFDTVDDILDFLLWDSGYESLPEFDELDISVADLVVGLLEPLPSYRYGFEQVKSHKYFKKEDETSEFDD